MASTQHIIDGMQLLLQFYKKPGGYHTFADNDMIFMRTPDLPLTNEAVVKLHELGWHQDRDDDEPYDPEKGWYIFT